MSKHSEENVFLGGKIYLVDKKKKWIAIYLKLYTTTVFCTFNLASFIEHEINLINLHKLVAQRKNAVSYL